MVVCIAQPTRLPLCPRARLLYCAERTAHLRPGTQFIKSFWMTEGVRTTNSSVVRCGGRSKAGIVWPGPLLLCTICNSAGRGILLTCPALPPPACCCRNAVHKVNKQPVSIKFYGCAAYALAGRVAALCLANCLFVAHHCQTLPQL